MGVKQETKKQEKLGTLADVYDAMGAATAAQRAATTQLSDAAVRKLDNHGLTMAHNGGSLSPERYEAEQQRRQDQAFRNKWHGQSLELDAIPLSDMLELKARGWITELQFARQRARVQRRLADGRNAWMKHRPDLKAPPRTRDDELMLMDETDLMQLRNGARRESDKTAIYRGHEFSFAELAAEYESRRAHKVKV